MGPGADFADFNGDGFLDLFVSRHAQMQGGQSNPNHQKLGNGLYLSDGAWDVFRDVSPKVGIQNEQAYNRQPSIADVNQDGWLDIAVGCDNIKEAQGGVPHSRLYVFEPTVAQASSLRAVQESNASRMLTPLSGHFVDIGGIRVPFLAQWKGKLPAGAVYRQMVMGFDCHATALAAASGTGFQPVSEQGLRQAGSLSHLDGVNLLPFLTGEKQCRPHEQLFWRTGEKQAARVGDWKLVQDRGGETQLFNLKDDLGEQTDLAATEPAKLKELQAAYDAWDKQMVPAQWVRQDGRSQLGAGLGKAKTGGIAERFRQYDQNSDGKLTPTEFPLDAFTQIDKNNDRVLTLDEVRAFYGGGRRRQSASEKPQ